MSRQPTQVSAYLIMVALAANGTYAAGPTTLTFGELPFQSVDGLSFQGVKFGYNLENTNSPDAYYHSYGPGSLDMIDDPSLTGNSAGILILTFDQPTPILQFGAALNTGNPLSPGFTVELFDEGLNSIGISSVDTIPATGVLGFSEALFLHSGTLVLRAFIDFADAPGSFALDNLTYHPIPEPTSLLMGILGILMLRPCRSINSTES